MASTSRLSTKPKGKTFKRTDDVLAEIFADSDSEWDESDTDADAESDVDSDVEPDSEAEESIDEPSHDSDSDVPPPTKKTKTGGKQKTQKITEPKFEWKKDQFTPNNFTFTDFTGINPDILSILPDEPSALDYLSLFVHDELIDVIVRETNIYAQQYIESTQLPRHSRVQKWKPTTHSEMKLFLGISLLMGLIRKPNIEFYWSEKDLFSTPSIPKLMTRNRFCLILKFLHFANNANKDNETDGTKDKLYKMREVYDLLTESFSSVFVPGQRVAIDEGMIRWFGRGFRTYLPSKRAKYGMKAYKLCDDSGYTYKFQLYVGQSNNEPNTLHGLVMNLMHDLLDGGRTLYMDNYYNSPALALELFQRKTHTVGTLRMNRKGVPKDMSKLKLKRGETDFRTCPPITIMVWHDKRDVHMITTAHDASMAVVPGKTDRSSGQPVQKPKCVIEYNQHMGAVDKSDQMVLLNSTVRKTLKWTKKLFFHLLDLAAANAYILCTKNTGPKKHFKFAKELCADLISCSTSDPDYTRPKKAGRVTPSTDERLELKASTHWPVEIPPTAKQQAPRHECVVCKSHKPTTGKRWQHGESRKRVQTRYRCGGCSDQPALCITPCFGVYHTRKHY